jgi:hypothetical protein
MCKESSFADYIAQESDFIDIFVQLVQSHFENLPLPISQTDHSLSGP